MQLALGVAKSNKLCY